MSTEVTNAVQSYFAAIDGRHWDKVLSMMHTPFYLDYSSFGAGPGTDLSPGNVLDQWKLLLPGFDATHHQLSPLIIEENGNTATVRAYVTASHQISAAEGGDLWTVYGSYVLGLRKTDGKWRLSSNVFCFKFMTGNMELPAIAQSRAGSQTSTL